MRWTKDTFSIRTPYVSGVKLNIVAEQAAIDHRHHRSQPSIQISLRARYGMADSV